MPKKTEFIYDGFGEEQPVLGMSINGFSDVMEAKLIDGRILSFAVKTKCNKDARCGCEMTANNSLAIRSDPH